MALTPTHLLILQKVLKIDALLKEYIALCCKSAASKVPSFTFPLLLLWFLFWTPKVCNKIEASYRYELLAVLIRKFLEVTLYYLVLYISYIRHILWWNIYNTFFLQRKTYILYKFHQHKVEALEKYCYIRCLTLENTMPKEISQ